jgi:hypothetical protein
LTAAAARIAQLNIVDALFLVVAQKNPESQKGIFAGLRQRSEESQTFASGRGGGS